MIAYLSNIASLHIEFMINKMLVNDKDNVPGSENSVDSWDKYLL